MLTRRDAIHETSRRSFLAAAAATLAAPAAFAQSAAQTKFTVILDWFVNPDHASLFTARYIGAFDRAGLDVVLVPPTDPDLPPRLLAAGKADAAISYQTQLYLLVDQGLPVRRTGTLINKPLRTVTALKRSGIEKLTDLKGKKVGYAIAGRRAGADRHDAAPCRPQPVGRDAGEREFRAGDGADVERGRCGDRHLPHL